MSDQNSQEPTMEEILASIRRIISEDDAPAPPAELPIAPPEPGREHGPAFDPMSLVPADDDVLELTDRLDEPLQTVGDLDVFSVEEDYEPEPEPAAPAPSPTFAAPAHEDAIVSPPTAGVAATAFGQLDRQVLMPADGRSLEDVVRELLRPLLKGWLDEHLPGIVQSAVEAEVERISRQRR
jgi:hypothetical protein